jgi:hypothetical protein
MYSRGFLSICPPDSGIYMSNRNLEPDFASIFFEIDYRSNDQATNAFLETL